MTYPFSFGKRTHMNDQQGRTVVVTGAGSGFGAAATRVLAGRGAHVVMAARDTAKATRVRDEIVAEQPGARLTVRALDLFDPASVRAFAEATDEVDVLLANAGLGSMQRVVGPLGVERGFATNHLGHFALAALLFPRMERAAAPRVVTVSSSLYRRGRIPEDLTYRGRAAMLRSYNDSKLANALFAVELGRRTAAAGSPVASVLVHPGMASTPMQDGHPAPVRAVLGLLTRWVGNSVDAGAAALVEGVVGRVPAAGIIGPDRHGGRPEVQALRAPADDVELARRLWERSEELTGVPFPVRAPAV
ncbi:hypothetical protein AD006_10675 [Pseudonocardia sp. EC080610-09]|nr:hypothetical protein AD006_10675 [Pseudonocardia sp. EC080610-09]ALL82684.1 hypothetical protein AD017_18505 [Pseudonocardia sp. EC080619-01]